MLVNHIRKFYPITYLLTSIIIASSFIINISGCKDKVTDPPEEPSGYQEDIPWPSLADSPWPMYRADPQQTGRSKWENNLTGTIDTSEKRFNNESSISIGSDGSMYFNESNYKNIYCLDSSGKVKWVAQLSMAPEGGYYSPVVLKDGSILAADLSYLFKFNQNGQELWRFPYNFPRLRTINVGKDGIIYMVGNMTTLLAISQDGQLLWQLEDTSEWWVSSVSAISPDGNTLYLNGNYLSAVDLVEHKIKWNTQFWTSPPLIDCRGNIFCLTTTEPDSLSLICMNKDAEILWRFTFKDLAEFLTMDKNGNIYFGDATVYSVNYFGKLNWKLPHVNEQQPIMCDNKNNIYVIGVTNAGLSVKCISENGSTIWQTDYNAQNYNPAYGGAVGFNKLYLPDWGMNKSIYIIH